MLPDLGRVFAGPGEGLAGPGADFVPGQGPYRDICLPDRRDGGLPGLVRGWAGQDALPSRGGDWGGLSLVGGMMGG